MGKSPAPTLDDLLDRDTPAWLWDTDRGRIVWANEAGTAAFGAESLFDLLDLVFSPSDPSIEQLKGVARDLRRGDSARATFTFAGTIDDQPLECDCYIHALADGRAGLLTCVRKTSTSQTDHGVADWMQTALSNLPLGFCTTDAHGKILYCNQAAIDILGKGCGLPVKPDLLARCFATGSIGLVIKADTPFGRRDIRLMLKPLVKSDRLADATFQALFEDITERRALEKNLMDAVGKEPDEIEENLSAEAAADLSHFSPDDVVFDPTTPDTDEPHEPTLAQEPISIIDVPPRPAQQQVPEKHHEQPTGEVPQIVSSTLDTMPQPIAIVSRDADLLFANKAACALLEADDWSELAEYSLLADALGALEGRDGSISVFTMNDNPIALDVIVSTFPWQGGSVYQATMTPADNGESADNRRGRNPAAKPLLQSSRKKKGPVEPARSRPPGPDEAELRAILDTATDGIVTLDQDGNIASFSAGAQALFALEGSDQIGQPFASLFTEDSAKVIRDYLAALSGTGLAAIFNDGREVTARIDNGGTVPMFVTIGKLDPSTGRDHGVSQSVASFCAVIRDITQWKKTEAELRKAKEEAEQSSARKSNFLANISHELRTPLNAIMGFSEVMRTERFGKIPNKKYLAYADDIHASGEHLLSLINDLLDLSKVESGKLEMNFAAVNLANLIADATNLLQDSAAERKIRLQTSVDDNLPSIVADTRSMKQVLINLLSNAIKYTRKGGKVKVSAQLLDNGSLRLTVKDSGPGMTKSELKQALEPFQQVSRDDNGQTLGTGLGLPLTRALVEANRAEFKINSKPSRGTRIRITFPITRVLAG